MGLKWHMHFRALLRVLLLTGVAVLPAAGLVGLASAGDTPEQRALARIKQMQSKSEWLPTMRSIFGEARSASKRVEALGAIKQLDTSVLMYTADYDEYLPPMTKDQEFHDVLYPYAKNESLFTESATGRPWGRNIALSGKSLTGIESPSETILLYGRSVDAKGLRCVAYADGHVKNLDEKMAAAIFAKSGIKFEPGIAAVNPRGGPIAEPDPRSATLEELLAYDLAVRRSNLMVALADARQLKLPAWTSSSAEQLLPLCPNLSLSGKDLASIPSGQVLVYEVEGDGSGRRLIGFAGGRIEEISDADLAARRAELGLGSPVQFDFEKKARAELASLEYMMDAISLGDSGALLPVFRQAKRAAQKTVTISNLKQLALGVIGYESDHDEKLPSMSSPEAISNRLRPYVKNENILRDPLLELPYVYANALSGKSLASIERVADTPMMFEAASYDGLRAVAFLDGHVRRVSDAEFAKLMVPLGGAPVQSERITKLAAVAAQLVRLDQDPSRTTYDKIMVLIQPEARGEFVLGKPISDSEAISRADKLLADLLAIPSPPKKLFGEVVDAVAWQFWQLGDEKRARAAYEHTPPGYKPDPAGFALRLASGDVAGLVPDLEAAAKDAEDQKPNNPDDYLHEAPSLYLTLGSAHLLAGNNGAAEHDLQTARECALQTLNSVYFAILINQEALYQQLGRRSKGFALLADSLELQSAWNELLTQSKIHDLIAAAEGMSSRQFSSEARRIFADRARNEASLKLTAALIADPARADNSDHLSAMLGQSGEVDIYTKSFMASSMLETARLYAEAGDVSGLERCLAKANPDEAPFEVARVSAGREKTSLSAVLGARTGHPETGLATLEATLKDPKLAKAPALTPARTQYKRLSRDLALVQLAAGRRADALGTLDALLQSEESELNIVLAGSSEDDATAFVDEIQKSLDAYLTALFSGVANGEEAAKVAAWTARRKGRVLDALARSRRVQTAIDADPAISAVAAHLKDARAKLAEAVASGRGEDEAADAIDRLESELAAKAAGGSPGQEPTGEAVAAKLNDKEVLIEYQIYERPAYGMGPAATPRRNLAAFVYRKNASPAAYDLGDWNAVEPDLATTRSYFTGPGMRSNNKTAARVATYEDYSTAATRLRQKLIDPLRATLQGAGSITICPDGELSRLSFEGLPDGDGRYLVQNYTISYVGSCRDLFTPAPPSGSGVAIFSGPDYDAVVSESRSHSSRPPESLSMRFDRLEGAEKEGTEIEQALAGSSFGEVRLLSGASATKSAFRSVRSRVLHFATHGFVLPLRPPELKTIAVSEESVQVARVHVHDDPLARSGLALAGANRAASGGGAEGWLTASEILDADLSGTDLVVLSACDTGLGQVRTGEGVFGLRRAFRLAGARTIVMSLAEVADEPTRAFMRDFYSGLAAGKPYLVAFHEAQLHAIDREGAKGGLSWAAFIFARG